jgi:hypothetical protein
MPCGFAGAESAGGGRKIRISIPPRPGFLTIERLKFTRIRENLCNLTARDCCVVTTIRASLSAAAVQI